MIPFESRNERAYVLLLRLEVAVREALKEAMKAEFGTRWQKQIPGDLREKIKEAQTDEAKPQFDFVRLGPLYYLTFGELLQLLKRKPGRAVADRFGGEAFLRQLENLFGPRNAVCHSRPVSSVGLKAIEALYSQIEAALGAGGLAQLVATPDVGLRQAEAAGVLVPALAITLGSLRTLPQRFSVPDSYDDAAAQYWWDDDALAGFRCATVERCIALLREYNDLPGGVGSSGPRQTFIEQHDLEARIQEALRELERVKP